MPYHRGMELSRRTVRLLIALLAISLVGLVVLQIILLDGARHQKDQAFDRAVRASLAQVTRTLDTGEVADHVITHWTTADSMHTMPPIEILSSDSSMAHRGIVAMGIMDTFVIDSEPLMATIIVDSNTTSRSQMVRQIMLDLDGQSRLPVTERLDTVRLDSLLHDHLALADLDLAVQYGVALSGRDSLLMQSPAADTAALSVSPFRSRLFPSDFMPPYHDLVLHFPNRRAWTWRQTGPLVMGSLVLTTLVIACAVFAVRTIVAQRRFAAELVTFVDNLTHEFKTPLATMALASEALAREDVRDEPETMARYTGMINDEVGRIRKHVDRVLQLAYLERGQVALEPVDVHESLVTLLKGFTMKVSQRDGSLTTHFDADRCVVNADEVHLSGMVGNLLDNAVKYSPTKPDIEVATLNEDGQLVITVSDRGMGVPTRDHERVFDRYYRCQRGDRHDVKGFGLGLSYVRLMAEAHVGTVKLRGRTGGGTEVRLSLPLLLDGEGSA